MCLDARQRVRLVGERAQLAATAGSGWQMSGWGQALSSSASSSAPSKFESDAKTGWGSSMREWNKPEHKTETALLDKTQRSNDITWNAKATATESTIAHDTLDTTPTTSRVTTTDAFEALMTKSDESHPTAVAATTPDLLTMREDPTTIVDLVKLSDKVRRLGSKYGHKLMYVQGKEAPRNDVIFFGDKRAAFSAQASHVVGANATYWAAPIVSAGGPVLVDNLGATGKAQNGAVLVL